MSLRSTTISTLTISTLTPLILACACISQGYAQVVQLPSFRNFSYSGGAWVPDGGTVDLGGSRYAASSSSTRGWGPFAGRATGSGLGGTSVSASVQIIDLQAMDEAILSSGTASSAGNASASSTPSGQTATGTSSTAIASPLPLDAGRRFLSSPDAEEMAAAAVDTDPNAWQRALSGSGINKPLTPSQAESDVRYYIERGREAEQANRVLAARVYYKMALEAMTPEILERYRRILSSKQQAEKSVTPPATAQPADLGGRQSF